MVFDSRRLSCRALIDRPKFQRANSAFVLGYPEKHARELYGVGCCGCFQGGCLGSGRLHWGCLLLPHTCIETFAGTAWLLQSDWLATVGGTSLCTPFGRARSCYGRAMGRGEYRALPRHSGSMNAMRQVSELWHKLYVAEHALWRMKHEAIYSDLST